MLVSFLGRYAFTALFILVAVVALGVLIFGGEPAPRIDTPPANVDTADQRRAPQVGPVHRRWV